MNMFKKVAFFGTGLGLATPVLAAPVDLTALLAGVDFSTTTAAVLAVSVLLIAVYIALKASSIVERKVRGG